MYTGFLLSCPLCFSIIWASVRHISKFKSIRGEILTCERKATRNRWDVDTDGNHYAEWTEREGREKGDEWKDRRRKKGEMAGPTIRQNRLDRVNFFSLKSRYILFLFLKNKHYKKNLNRELKQWTNRRKNNIHFLNSQQKKETSLLAFHQNKTKNKKIKSRGAWRKGLTVQKMLLPCGEAGTVCVL